MRPLGTRNTQGATHLNPRNSSIVNRESGVALVITLILLSVITFMAVTFLVVSTSERKSVTGQTEQKQADLAANMAFEYGLASAMSRMLAGTNLFSYDLLVSTNYIRLAGFDTRPLAFANPTNVNFDYTATGAALTLAQQQQNLANLLFSPRVPVMITNPIAGSNEFRYYVDVNRNGLFEPTGPLLETNSAGFVITNSYVGDPQWIGILERPGFPHSSSNLFVQRFAFLVAPAGKSLDINHIYNDVSFASPGFGAKMPEGRDGFRRDQGFGTYEINLAAFLADLNTNIWWQPIPPMGPPNLVQYDYRNNAQTGPSFPNTGFAFEDALSLLRYRYNAAPDQLQLLAQALGPQAPREFASDNIDEYLIGPIMTNLWWGPPDSDPQRASFSVWPGVDGFGHNQFVSVQELFDKTKTARVSQGSLSLLNTFPDRLRAASLPPPAGIGTNNYNRYTFSRLIEQLGVDSASEAPGRMHLNYDNLVQARNGVVSVTNFIPWRPVDFFVNAANRLLTNAGFNFPPLTALSDPNSFGGQPTSGIRVFPTNYYTPSVHRLLQLAANIYDAANSRTIQGATNGNGESLQFPSVFRPVFRSSLTNIYLVGYQEISGDTNQNALQSFLNLPPQNWHDLSNPSDRPGGNVWNDHMAYGVPLVVGAKKGWPNFNEFAMQTQAQIARKLQFQRELNSTNIIRTNQMYVLAVTNSFFANAWNSYSNACPRKISLSIDTRVNTVITNELGTLLLSNINSVVQPNWVGTNVLPNTWVGYPRMNSSYPQSFVIPVSTNYFILTNYEYSQLNQKFVPPSESFEVLPAPFPVPHWLFQMNAKVRCYMLDTTDPANPRIVDYVNLDSAQDPTRSAPVDLAPLLASDSGQPNSPAMAGGTVQIGDNWPTNRVFGVGDAFPTVGILNQILVCEGIASPPQANFDNYLKQGNGPGTSQTDAAIQFFRKQMGLTSADVTHGISNTFYAPFAPFRFVNFYTAWKANDPLVHYTIPDLTDSLNQRRNLELDTATFSSIAESNRINKHFQPWGGNPGGSGGPTAKMVSLKDPVLVNASPVHPDNCGRSDDWGFPTNKLPNIGWLGRVHRGTPWQTVYLKSLTNDLKTWTNWTGDLVLVTNTGQLSTNIVPVWQGNTNNGLQFAIIDGSMSLPETDRNILDLFTTAVNDNMTRGRLSINETNLAAWSAVLAGVNVLSNSTATGYTNMFIQPAGPYDAFNPASPIVQILTNINGFRASLTNQGQVFSRLGDILAVPRLTTNSPFLNLANPGSLTEAAYERIPQQILGLLQCDPRPRFVIYAYGQALKPAEHSLITSQPLFGMCTNYQVMAETATRTVVRVEGTGTGSHAVIESFNVLPPD